LLKAARAPAAEHGSDGHRVREVVGDLRRERQRTDAGEAPPDDPQVQRGDRQAGGRRPRRRSPLRENRGEHERPAQRQRDVSDRRGRQQARHAPLFVSEQQRAGGE